MSAVWSWYKHKLGLHFVTSTPTALPHQAVECMLQCMNLWQSAFLVISIYGETSTGYLGDGGLGLNFGRIWRIDLKYFGRSVIDLLREQENGRNREIHRSTYLGAGRLASLSIAKNNTKLREISVVWVEKCMKMTISMTSPTHIKSYNFF